MGGKRNRREGKERGRGGEGERKGGKEPALPVKHRSRALPKFVQIGRKVASIDKQMEYSANLLMLVL